MENCAPPSIRYISEHYDLPITVNQLAEIERYNVTYYNDWFKQQTGVSQSLYLRRVRVRKAQDLLAHISLCTGIGAGVVFWGAAEPLIFAMDIPAYTGLESGSDGAVLWSMVRCFLEWGLTPYATCVVTGVILAYLILNKNAPFKTSSLLIPLFGENAVESKWTEAFDAWSAFALTAAVAGGLGYGAMQLSAAVKAFAGIQPSTLTYVVIIIFIFVCYNASAVCGLRAGITWLSNRNVQLFFL